MSDTDLSSVSVSAPVQIQFAVDSEATATAIVTALLEGRLAACCQLVGPIQSRYWWQGALEAATEWLVLAKTVEQHRAAVVATVERLHPYATPEILVVPLLGGSTAYLDWLVAATTLGPGRAAGSVTDEHGRR